MKRSVIADRFSLAGEASKAKWHMEGNADGGAWAELSLSSTELQCLLVETGPGNESQAQIDLRVEIVDGVVMFGPEQRVQYEKFVDAVSGFVRD